MSPIPTKEPLLVDAEPEQPTQLQRAEPVSDVTGLALVVERLAANPDVDVTKLEKIIELQERILNHQAREAFNTAFAKMQGEIPTIVEKGRGDKGMTYARLEDIVAQVRPILQKHGFTLSHRTEWPDTKTVKVIGILTHERGHERASEFLSAADQSGSKNAIQALGSAVSYGRRYTTKDLLAIVTTDEDDDGASSEKHQAGPAPDGYDDFLDNMTACADEGWPRLSKAFGDARADYRKRLTTTDKDTWAKLRKKAEGVTKGGRA